MSKLGSRKFLLTLAAAVGGGITGLTGYLTGDEKSFYAGIGAAVAVILGYLKAEKDVDVAHADAEAQLLSQQLFHDQHCPVCNKKD